MEKQHKNIDDNLLLRYILGEVSDDDKRCVDAWISSGQENARYFSSFEEIVKKQKNYNFYHQIDVEAKWKELNQSKTRKINRKNHFNALKIAASIIIIFSLGYLINRTVINNLQINTITYVSDNENKIYYLPDSSSIILPKGSEISYAKNFNRQVALTGDGFFNITKDTHNPFLVKLPDSEIKVLGTSFEVLNNDLLIISLYSGKISYSNQGEENILNPGQRIIRKNDMEAEINEFVDSSTVLKFDSVSLKSVCNKMENIYLYKFSIEEGLENLQITGDFTNVSIHEFLNTLSFLFDLKSSIKGRYIIISRLKS